MKLGMKLGTWFRLVWFFVRVQRFILMLPALWGSTALVAPNVQRHTRRQAARALADSFQADILTRTGNPRLKVPKGLRRRFGARLDAK